MNRKLIYLLNPISGTKDKTWLRDKIQSATTTANLPFELMYTNPEGNYSEVRKMVTGQGFTDVIICGGDGTINHVVADLQDLNINFGILPMGSGNGLARAAGIPTNIDEALQIVFNGNASSIDCFYINDRFSCMLCGLGFDAQVAHDFAKEKTRGLMTYIRKTVQNFFIAPVYPFIIINKGTEISTEAFFISVANSNQFGNNVTIAPEASISDGLLDIVIVKKMSKVKMLYALLVQLNLGKVIPFTEKKFKTSDIHYFQTKELQIRNPGGAPLHIDGDPCVTAENFHISIKENAFRLLQPLLSQ